MQPGASAKKELATFQAQEKAITAIEKRLKDLKATLKTKTDELDLKLQLKRLGGDEFKAESGTDRPGGGWPCEARSCQQRGQKEDHIPDQGQGRPDSPPARTDALLTAIGGQLTAEEAGN
jgi:type I restriction enzyme M protein